MAVDRKVTDVIAKAGGLPKHLATRVAEALQAQGMVALAFVPAEATKPPREVPVTISLRLELGVAGYHSGCRDFTGNIDKVAADLDRTARRHFNAVYAAWQRHGDHRNYCPQLGNGYPSNDPSDGETATFSVQSVELLRDREKPEPVSYHSRLHRFLQEVANGDHRDVPKAVADFRERLRGKALSAPEASGPVPR